VQQHTRPRPARNVLGIVALVLGVLALLGGSISLAVQTGLVSAGDYRAIAVVSGILATFQGVLAVAAIACGGIGLALKDRSRGTAGIGLGIGIAVLWSVLGGVVYGAFLQFVPF
jgi:hypothetical protein